MLDLTSPRPMPPAHLTHPLLGPLEWDERRERYRGLRGALSFTISPFSRTPRAERTAEELDQVAAVLDRAARRLGLCLEREEAVKERAVECLLHVYNEHWRHEWDPESQEETELPALDAAGFKARLHFEAVDLQLALDGTVWLADGGLFAGHRIGVPFDTQGALLEASF